MVTPARCASRGVGSVRREEFEQEIVRLGQRVEIGSTAARPEIRLGAGPDVVDDRELAFAERRRPRISGITGYDWHPKAVRASG